DETAERIVHEFLNYYPTRMGVDHRPLSDAAVYDVIQQIEDNLHLLDDNFVERSDYVLDQFFNIHFRLLVFRLSKGTHGFHQRVTL
ncbi:MAG: hypothetical protein MUC65_05180, partial [Pontiellaceae bacterium]|nr:hypothetical protein [Pontiellaceae bacterium]